MGRGRAALLGSHRPAATPKGPRAQAVLPVIGGLGHGGALVVVAVPGQFMDGHVDTECWW